MRIFILILFLFLSCIINAQTFQIGTETVSHATGTFAASAPLTSDETSRFLNSQSSAFGDSILSRAAGQIQTISSGMFPVSGYRLLSISENGDKVWSAGAASTILAPDETSRFLNAQPSDFWDSILDRIAGQTQVTTIEDMFPASGYRLSSILGSSDQVRTTSARLTDGKASTFLAYSSYSLYTENGNAGISIDQKSGSSFGLFTDTAKGTVGWTNPSGKTLSIGASYILAEGDVLAAGCFKSNSGLIISNGALAQTSLPQHTLAYLASNANNIERVLFANQNGGDLAGTSLQMDANGVINSLTTYSENHRQFGIRSGAFVVLSTSQQGILFDALQVNNSIAPDIRLAIKDKVVARFMQEGFIPNEMTTEEIFAIQNPTEGLELYNKTIHKKCIYNGTSWDVESTYPLARPINGLHI